MSSSWTKFHERHGSSTKPQYICGPYISDPSQYYAGQLSSKQKKGSMLKKVVSCLGFGRCFSRRKKNDIDTRYMYSMDPFEENRDNSGFLTPHRNGGQKVIHT